MPDRVTDTVAARFAQERCQAWDQVHRQFFPDYDTRWARAIEILRGGVSDRARVLDLGCGPGSLTARLADSLDTARVVGVDLDPLLIELARAAHPAPSVRFVSADVLSSGAALTLRAFGPFGAVVSSAFMHYFDTEQLASVHAVIARLLAPGGLLVTVERFAPSTPRTQETPSRAGQSPWDAWWQETREHAPHFGLTPGAAIAESAVGSAAEPPPLTQEGYLESMKEAGFTVIALDMLPGGSTVVTATRPASAARETRP